MAKTTQAKGIRNSGPALDRLSRLIEAELSACLDRCLARHKPEAIGAAVDRGRSAIYEWRNEPSRIPAAKIAQLAQFDPEPDGLLYVANLLMQAAAHVASQRRRKKQSVVLSDQVPLALAFEEDD